MPSTIYPKYKEAVLSAASNTSMVSEDVRVALVDTDTYTFSNADQYYSDLSGVVADSEILASKSVTNGVFDADSAVVISASGSEAEALVVYIDTGNANTSRVVTYIDSGVTGIPVSPNGGNINIDWATEGIFTL